MRKRIFYLIFPFSLFLLSGLFRGQREELRAPGGGEFSEPRRVAHYFVVAVIAAISGWYSVVQLRKDWATLRDRNKK
ncbi:MAG: hypothetical protein DME22_23030 [Verrucomicrobia bacterium]|nr:MAG: hypothetical protein DME22_23030 [Verrucomicrobiota bacterium]